MARIGEYIPFIAYVYGREGSVAHFHLLKGNPDSPSWQTCIKIRTAEYFHHTGKEEILNSGERKEMIDFLNKPNRYISSVSNWQYLVAQWSSNNPRWEIDANTPMPDYLLLPQK
jgi:hypothetical protein